MTTVARSAACAALLAAVGALGDYSSHRSCVHGGRPIAVAERGTPRGDYCHALHAAGGHWLLVAAPAAIGALAGLIRSASWRAIAVGAVAIVLAANAVVVGSLQHALTI